MFVTEAPCEAHDMCTWKIDISELFKYFTFFGTTTKCYVLLSIGVTP